MSALLRVGEKIRNVRSLVSRAVVGTSVSSMLTSRWSSFRHFGAAAAASGNQGSGSHQQQQSSHSSQDSGKTHKINPKISIAAVALMVGASIVSLPKDENVDYHDLGARARVHARSHQALRERLAETNPMREVSAVLSKDEPTETPEEEAARREAEQAFIKSLEAPAPVVHTTTDESVANEVATEQEAMASAVEQSEQSVISTSTEAASQEETTPSSSFVLKESDLANGDWVVVSLPGDALTICVERDTYTQFSKEGRDMSSMDVVGVLFNADGTAIPVCRPTKSESTATPAAQEESKEVDLSDLGAIVAFVDSIPGLEFESTPAAETTSTSAPEPAQEQQTVSQTTTSEPAAAPESTADSAPQFPTLRTLEEGFAALSALIASKAVFASETAASETKNVETESVTPTPSETQTEAANVSATDVTEAPQVAAPTTTEASVPVESNSADFAKDAEPAAVCPVPVPAAAEVAEAPVAAELPQTPVEQAEVAVPTETVEAAPEVTETTTVPEVVTEVETPAAVEVAAEPEIEEAAPVEPEEPVEEPKRYKVAPGEHVLGPQAPPKRDARKAKLAHDFHAHDVQGDAENNSKHVMGAPLESTDALHPSSAQLHKEAEIRAAEAEIAARAANAALAAAQEAALAASLADELEEEREQDVADTADLKELDEDSPMDHVHRIQLPTPGLRIFSGNGNQALAAEVCSALNLQLGRADVGAFVDGEVSVQVKENVRGKNCYVIQSLCGPNPNNQLMELLLLVSSLRRASANKITAVIPYFAYARQLDANTVNRTNIAAADIAIMLETLGVDQVITVDLHRPEVMGFFEKTPVENLDTQSAAIPYLIDSKDLKVRSSAVVAPVGATVKRAVKFRNALAREGCDVAMCFSYPTKQGRGVGSDEEHHSDLKDSADNIEILGNVRGRDAIIVDDMIDSASRVCSVSKALKAHGARRVYAYATHGLFTGDALQRIEDSPLQEVLVFNTVPVPANKRFSTLRQLSAAPLIAETVRRVNENKGTADLVHNLAEYS